MNLYLIKRPMKPAMHPSLTWHPVILCTARHTARWESMDTNRRCWVWGRSTHRDGGAGFLLVKWQGLELDYGTVVHSIILPDGVTAGFCHPGNPDPEHRAVWNLLNHATWWSKHPLPEWLANRGVKLAEDEFTQERIAEDAGTCLLPYSQQRRLKGQ